MPQKPLFDPLESRSVGCLAHLSSLPSHHGIGNLGSGTCAFLDLLKDCGMSSWQLCPIGPTGFGDSPYSSFSAFAGNPNFIDWDEFVPHGLVHFHELNPLRSLPKNRAAYDELNSVLTPLDKEVGKRWIKNPKDLDPVFTFERFCEEAAYWLDDYARFRVLKDAFGQINWIEWPEPYRSSTTARSAKMPKGTSEDDILIEKFIQYVFYYQWKRIKSYAAQRSIQIIGDIPIFVAQDSADVWAHPELFFLKKDGSPKVVAGVPPDYFSEDGQRWGNPLYNWSKHKAEGYTWWIERMRSAYICFDSVRLDHFRGFEAYWEIPADQETARIGKWVKGPGLPFFKAIKKEFPNASIIAEDLGVITDEVNALRDACGFPGMAILQFAFGGDSKNIYLPHNLSSNQAVYPGTHDNDTSLGWYRNASPVAKDHFRRYLRVSGENACWDLIRTAYASVSALAIIPLQDLISLGSEARFNTPGAALGNWQWRVTASQLEKLKRESHTYLRALAQLYGRL